MKKLLLFFLATAFVIFFGASRGSAQTGGPEFLITWRSQSYAPPDFNGKLLPAPRSPILASFELVEGGSLVNISKETVYWYLDGKLIASGAGLRTVTFQASDLPGTIHTLRPQINSYKGQSRIVLKTIEIPVATPEVVIETSLPGNVFQNQAFTVIGKPYFFRVKALSDLKFAWTVNGETPIGADDPSSLTVSFSEELRSGEKVKINLEVKNPANIFEVASRLINLSFRK